MSRRIPAYHQLTLEFPAFEPGATVMHGAWRIPPRIEGGLIVADDKVVVHLKGWVLDDPGYYADYLKREAIEWERYFTVIRFTSEPGVIRHEAVCGSVKSPALSP